jgi:hypothetical protein
VGALPLDVATGDLDGDLAPDVVTANAASGDVSILFNDGAANLAPQTRIPVGGDPRSVAVGDLDGDGDNDIAVGRHQATPTLSILFNEGDGTFAAPSPAGAATLFPDAVRILDLDGDDDNDVVLASPASGFVAVLRNAGDGTFADETLYPLGTAPSYPSDLTVGDLDGDGDPDLAVSASLSLAPPCFLLNDGDGAFGPFQTYTTSTAIFVSVACGDVDRDGDEDLAVLDFATNRIALHANDGAATFGEPSSHAIGTSTQPGGIVRLGDLDGDGWLDAAVAPFLSNPAVPVLLGDREGGFGAPALYEAGYGPSAIGIVDLDGDLDLDLVVTNKDVDELSVLLNSSASATDAPEAAAAGGVALGIPRPNPSRGSASIEYRVPGAGGVKLAVYDALGRLVRVLVEDDLPAGTHYAAWDGASRSGAPAPAGVYFLLLDAGGSRASRKALRLR